MNELKLKDSVRVTLPTITFSQYEQLMREAETVANHLETVEVTEDNIKESKKMLADVNRGLKTLNDRRIQIKKEILKPYDEFADQIKEIEQVVETADRSVRDQVRELENRERESKQKELKDIWNARIAMYDRAVLFSFEDWLEPRHLNKTQAINKSEAEMVDFLEKAEKDIEVLETMPESDDLILSYRQTRDVSAAIKSNQVRKNLIQEQKQTLRPTNEDVFTFSVRGAKDKAFVELLLQQNNIDYKEIK